MLLINGKWMKFQELYIKREGRNPDLIERLQYIIDQTWDFENV